MLVPKMSSLRSALGAFFLSLSVCPSPASLVFCFRIIGSAQFAAAASTPSEKSVLRTKGERGETVQSARMQSKHVAFMRLLTSLIRMFSEENRSRSLGREGKRGDETHQNKVSSFQTVVLN